MRADGKASKDREAQSRPDETKMKISLPRGIHFAHFFVKKSNKVCYTFHKIASEKMGAKIKRADSANSQSHLLALEEESPALALYKFEEAG
jgi:hypothetical protein